MVMTEKRFIALVLLAIFACFLLCLGIGAWFTRAHGAVVTYRFLPIGPRTGDLKWYLEPETECPTDAIVLDPTPPQSAVSVAAYGGGANGDWWTRGAFYFDTSILAGKDILNGLFRAKVVNRSASGFNLTYDFRPDGCLSNPLAATDTMCYAAADTATTAWPAVNAWVAVGNIRPTHLSGAAVGVVVRGSDEGYPYTCDSYAHRYVNFYGTIGDTATQPHLLIDVLEADAPAVTPVKAVFKAAKIPSQDGDHASPATQTHGDRPKRK